MRSPISLVRAVAVALVAIGSVASLSQAAFAANRTWTPVVSGSTAARWGTAAVYASNWSGGVTNPTAADSAIFNSNAVTPRTVTPIAGNAVPIGDIKISGSNSVIFADATNAKIVISGTGGSPNVGISVTGAGNATFNGNVLVNSATMTFQATGAGRMIFGSKGLDLQGNYLKVAGNATQGSVGSSVSGATYEVVSGTQALTFDGTYGVNISTVVISGGRVSGDGSSGSNLTLSGGTYVGGGTYQNVVSSAGTIQLLASEVLSTTSFTQTAGGKIQMNVFSDLSSASVMGNFELGGAFELDASNLGANLYSAGTTWDLFSGVNYTAGSPSPGNAASNFAVFAMSPASSSSPYYGNFTQFGQKWMSPVASDGTYLVFEAQTGNLVVNLVAVPEPSTMVFAGLGVAMSGWRMWRKRRFSKRLAAKAG